MLNITITENYLRITGHAGYAAHGSDIVCAAATILAYAAAGCIKDAHTRGELESEPEITLAPGNIIIRCIPKKEHSKTVCTVFATARQGYRMLARSYPANAELRL